MAQKNRVHASREMTPAERLAWERAQAMERQRRLGRAFTRPERAEEVLGQTEGESRLETTRRVSQVDRARNRGRR